MKDNATFVGTAYFKDAGVYLAKRKDGTVTVGQMNRKGVNVEAGIVDFSNESVLRSQR